MAINFTALTDDLEACLDTHNVSAKNDHDQTHYWLNEAYSRKMAQSGQSAAIRAYAEANPLPLFTQTVYSAELTASVAEKPTWVNETTETFPDIFGPNDRHFMSSTGSKCWYYWNGAKWKKVCLP